MNESTLSQSYLFTKSDGSGRRDHIAACFFGILTSMSRQALVGLIVGIPLLLLLSARRRRWLLWVALSAMTLSALLIAMYTGAPETSISAIRKDPSSMDRVYLSTVSAKMFLARPLTGVGISAFPSAYVAFQDPRVTVEVTDGHQMPFSIPAELGLLGLIVEAWMFAALAYTVHRAYRSSALPSGATGAIAAGAALSTMSFFNTFVFFESCWITLALIGAVMLEMGWATAFKRES